MIINNIAMNIIIRYKLGTLQRLADSYVCYDCTALVQKIYDELKKTEERFSAVSCVQPHVPVVSPTPQALLSVGSPEAFIGDSLRQRLVMTRKA